MSYSGKVLRVNLTDRKATIIPLPDQLKSGYLGGRGFGIKMLYELMLKGTDPLSPSSMLVFSTGVLDGTMAPGSASLTACARSPLTGFIGMDTTEGFWASELKFAGYDMLIIEGASSELVYLEISDDTCHIRPAAWLKGRTTSTTTDLLHEKLGDDYKIAAIGPAGEALIPYASIVCDYMDQLSRTGLGAVMGSKNLKAIAVHGTRDISLYSTDRFLQKMRDLHTRVRSDRMFNVMSHYGTTDLLNVAYSHGAVLIRNGQDGVYNKKLSGLSRNAIDNVVRSSELKLVDRPCSACMMPCKAVFETVYGRRSRPGFAEITSLGSNTGVGNAGTLIEASHLCEDLGLDPVSMGGSIAFLMECYQRGLFTAAALEWGSDEMLLELIRQTATRQGIGAFLAQGVLAMSRQIGGSRDFAMEVKGLEIPAIDGRAAKAHALAMAVCNRGGDTGLHMPQFEILDKTETEAENEFIFASSANPLNWQGKANMVIWHEYFGAVLDSVGICKHYAFTTYAIKPADVAELLTYATGNSYSEMEVMLIGERISTVERLFNLRHGLNPRLHDVLPPRLLRERLREGKGSGQVVELAKMLEEYYSLRGFSSDGLPRIESLQSLNIVSERIGLKN